VSIDQIRQLNVGSIGEGDLIRVGQELVISVPTPQPTSLPTSTPPPATLTPTLAPPTPTVPSPTPTGEPPTPQATESGGEPHGSDIPAGVIAAGGVLMAVLAGGLVALYFLRWRK
jgi:LysM repeat protein